MRKRAGVVATLALGAVLMSGSMAPASAVPKRPSFGPMIDAYTGYEGQERCSPSPKPGVLAFRNLIVDSYPYTGLGGISRACNIGGQSEHKEGRAWDWGTAYGNSAQRRAAEEVLDWLAAPDRFGNEAAVARRFGIMYAIWNKRIWFPGSGWRVYCRMRKGVCKDPEDHGVRDPHTSHVHFSFTWRGARKQTSFWHPSQTMIAAVASTPGGSGLWSIGGNGGVLPVGSSRYFGSKSDRSLSTPIVAGASTASGYGYWLVNKKGKVFSFGDARRYGAIDGSTRIADIASSPLGTGYWLVSRGGRVGDFGKVKTYGNAKGLGSDAVAIASTPTGKGYWILTKNGRVLNFGDAAYLGDANGKMDDAVDIAVTSTGLGYYIASTSGKVRAFGDAVGVASKSLSGNFVGIVATTAGYRIVGEKGSVRSFGDATPLRIQVPSLVGVVADLTRIDL